MGDFVKLSQLVDETFTIQVVKGYKFKKWDNAQRKMLTSDTPQEGYRKVYPIGTNKGILDLGAGQMGSILEAVQDNGKADLIGKTISVKSNGKTGIEIRYFFNPVKAQESTPDDLKDIPF